MENEDLTAVWRSAAGPSAARSQQRRPDVNARRRSSLSTIRSHMNVQPMNNMDIDEGSSPWGDVPSRSNSSQNISKAQKPEDTPADNSVQSEPAPSVPSAAPKSTSRRGRGGRRTYGTPQPTRLETVDDPLGPLGASSESLSQDEPPQPPQKNLEASQASASRASTRPTTDASTSSIRSMMDSVNLDDDEDDDRVGSGPRIPPPVQPPNSSVRQRATEPSMSIEQAAKPSFHISVGDPHKVGDLTSSHTVYAVRTKTTSKAYKTPEFQVTRRYRDFLWLYNQLHANSPGIIIPPPPEKQAVGRFDAEFVESRRAALERMLNKIAAHPVLQHDGDMKLFLESEAFNVDIKHKERKEPLLQTENKGMFGGLGLSVGGGGKFIEHDDWFHDRRLYLDALESQLRTLQTATSSVVQQRKDLSQTCSDLSASLHSLSTVELSPSLSGPLDALSDLQLRIKDLYDRQAQQDILTLGIVIDEYIRLIGSVKTAFNQRQKAYHAWHASESDLQKRKNALDKILRAGRSQQDRIEQLKAEVGDAERKSNAARVLFEDMGRLMRGELERFEKEKVEDFKGGVETWLESAVESQKELIELWETYLMQLDADEDGAPFGATVHPPAGVIASPSASNKSPPRPSDEGAETLGGSTLRGSEEGQGAEDSDA